MIKRVGFIGLGAMGMPMAQNVMKKGFPVTGYDVSPAATAAFQASGGAVAGSAADVASGVDLLITMLPTPDVIHDVYLGSRGILEGAHSRLVAIDMSTNDVALCLKLHGALAERRIRMLDCPVGRTQAHARAGTLLLLAGGPRALMEECKDVLLCMGNELIYCGGPGAGQSVKLLNNLLANLITAANAEVLALGVKAGLRVEALIDVFMQTGAGNNQLTGYLASKVLRGDTEPGFTLLLARKDQGLALKLGETLGVPLPLGAVCHQYMTEAIARGRGGQDVSALVAMAAETAGVRVALSPVPAGNRP
jgi:4-hydroxybutyrate dehydrogenase/sulfolactaldehyde 3-reductase